MTKRVRTHRAPGGGRVTPGLAAASLLVLAAIVLPLVVPLYARDEPRLWGFPFFYWYQLLWVFIAAGALSIAYQFVIAHERRRRAERDTGGEDENAGGER
jgi:hypothetical protein